MGLIFDFLDIWGENIERSKRENNEHLARSIGREMSLNDKEKNRLKERIAELEEDNKCLDFYINRWRQKCEMLENKYLELLEFCKNRDEEDETLP